MATKRRIDYFGRFIKPLTITTSTLYNIALGAGAVVYVSMIAPLWVGLMLAFLAVSNEIIDMIVQTRTVAKGESQLPQFIQNMELQKRPILAKFIGLVLILMGALQNTIRGGALIFNVLRGQSFFVISTKVIWQCVYGVAAIAGIYNLGNFSINFRKLWNKEINNSYEEKIIDLTKFVQENKIQKGQYENLGDNHIRLVNFDPAKVENKVNELAAQASQKQFWQINMGRFIDEASTVKGLETRLQDELRNKKGFLFIEDFQDILASKSDCPFRGKAIDLLSGCQGLKMCVAYDEDTTQKSTLAKKVSTASKMISGNYQASKKANKSNNFMGFLYSKFLNKQPWLFDKIVGGSMLLSALLYLVVDLKNLSKIIMRASVRGFGVSGIPAKLFGALFSTQLLPFGIMPIALAHGLYAYLNCMVLWGFNNFNFHAQNLEGDKQELAKQLSFTRFFHFGPSTRRIILYLRELILCTVDIMSAMLITPVFGLPLGITLLVATMMCRWVVFYFQSRQDPIDEWIKKDSWQGKLESVCSSMLTQDATAAPVSKHSPSIFSRITSMLSL